MAEKKDTGESAARDEDAVDPARREKLKALRAAGNAYPNDFLRQNFVAELTEAHEGTPRDDLDLRPVLVCIAGRIVRMTAGAKATFAILQDMSGMIQLYITDSYPGKALHRAFKQWDVGDIVGVEGVLFKTQSDEITVRVRGMRLLVKSLRPLPGALPALSDDAPRQRRRCVDPIMDDDVRLTFFQRGRIVRGLRSFMVAHAYLEVETPMMLPRAGAASAPSFSTHHDALDVELKLRTAADRYQQRLIVRGFEKVFEVSRTFRNERASPIHHPEFTLLEFHVAYRDHEHVMRVIEMMLGEVAQGAIGTTALAYQGRTFDLSAVFERLTLRDALKKCEPRYDDAFLENRETLAAHLKEKGIAFGEADTLGALQVALFEHTAAPALMNPTFVIGYPAEACPFARRSTADPRYADCFKLHIAGLKIASGWSVPNDPEAQASFGGQAGAGETRAMQSDPDYMRALETGMPPASGAVIGVDRLVMVLTDSPSIQDVILFPLVPRGDEAEAPVGDS